MTKRLTLSAKTVPPEADRWVKQGDNHEGVDGALKGDLYTARLTLDITPELAEAMVGYRQKNGDFKSLDDLKKVPGVDAAQLDTEKNRILF